MKNYTSFFIVSALLVAGCSNSTKDAQTLVDNAINVAGGDKFVNTEIEFSFRNKVYGYKKTTDGQFEYVRLFKDSLGLIRDELTNTGFIRKINGAKIATPDSMVQKYSNSINSVIYFALLPYGLNEQAVKKEFIGETELEGKLYDKIRVTFDQKGGGEDFQDEFIYWVSQDNSNIDYLAYKYYTDGGGLRFRKAINPRQVEGIRFVDYINYKPKKPVALNNMEQAFVNDQLEELSKIELEGITVIPL